jgi:arginase
MNEIDTLVFLIYPTFFHFGYLGCCRLVLIESGHLKVDKMDLSEASNFLQTFFASGALLNFAASQKRNMSKQMQIVGVTSELGAGTRGSSLGLDAIQIASLQYDRSFFLRNQEIRLETVNHHLYQETGLPYAKRLDGIAEMYSRIELSISESLKKEQFPLVISGDHSSAGGTIAGIKKAYPNKRLGVIWVDAHADLHSPYTSPSGNVHGMPLATAIHEDNLEHQNNQPEKETIWHWNEMKGSNQRVAAEDIVFIGVRSTEAPEEGIMERFKIPNFTVAQTRENGIEATTAASLEHLKDCDILYLSFDVDAMDPSISMGTGTPVADGFTEQEAKEILINLLNDKRFCCFEMVEINPLLDNKGNAMAEAAFRIFKPVFEHLEAKHKA